MESAALLSPADISVIRRYVQTKYAPLPGGKRAEIVADAIRRTLEQRLPALPADVKSRMSTELIRRCLLGEQREVRPEDVLEFCSELELPESETQRLLVEPMMQWIGERTPGLWSAEHVMSKLNRRKVIPLPIPSLVPAADGIPAATEPIEQVDPPEATLEQVRWRSWLNAIGRKPGIGWIAASSAIIAGVAAAVLLLPVEQSIVGNDTAKPPVAAAVQADIGMPLRLKYQDIDAAAVKSYLRSREALLAEEPYFGAIVDSARKHDVNPLLLFAIVGQEQGFVPKSNNHAKQIANNPFNVFHSWQEYNTSIRDSADIAARTIARRGQTRPEGHDPFEWFNKKYAEDPHWSDGVHKIFDKLSSMASPVTDRKE